MTISDGSRDFDSQKRGQDIVCSFLLKLCMKSTFWNKRGGPTSWTTFPSLDPPLTITFSMIDNSRWRWTQHSKSFYIFIIFYFMTNYWKVIGSLIKKFRSTISNILAEHNCFFINAICKKTDYRNSIQIINLAWSKLDCLKFYCESPQGSHVVQEFVLSGT